MGDTGVMSARTLDLRLRPDLGAPERARRSLDRLSGDLDDDLLEDVRLLVNELVTNSVKFAGRGSIRLRMKASPDAVRVEVLDEGPGFRAPNEDSEPSLEETSGRGLFLVEAIADRWGVEVDARTCVWFEIEAASAESA